MSKKRELSELEIRVGRSESYHKLSAREQWDDDKRKGILDWDGSKKWLDDHGKQFYTKLLNKSIKPYLG